MKMLRFVMVGFTASLLLGSVSAFGQGYQNPLEMPAYNKTPKRGGKVKKFDQWYADQGSPGSPTQNSNSGNQGRAQVLQQEINILRQRESALAKQSTQYPSMSSEARYNYDKERQATTNLRIAKEQELQGMQQRR